MTSDISESACMTAGVAGGGNLGSHLSGRHSQDGMKFVAFDHFRGVLAPV